MVGLLVRVVHRVVASLPVLAEPAGTATSASLPTRARRCAPCSPCSPPLLAQLPAARPGQQHAARRIDPGCLAALLRACGQADAAPPPKRAAAAPPGLAEPLTDRELEVLRLIAAGKSNQRIAHDLVVTPGTVKRHVTYVLGKLGPKAPANPRSKRPLPTRPGGPLAAPCRPATPD